MRFHAPFLALVAAVVAQNNAINIPQGGLKVTAGQPLTITWSNPSSSTVTIKLQQGSGVTPNTGITLLTGIPASQQTATFTVLADEVNNSQYNIEIIDDSKPSNDNFTPGFAVAGATCVGICDGSASTTGSVSSTGTASSTATGSSATSSASASSASVSSSSASASSSLVSSLSSSASSASASSASASSASASTSATAAATTSAPSAGSAGAIKAQAGFVIALVAAVIAF